METGKITMAELIIQTVLTYQSVLDIRITSEENTHGRLSLLLELSEENGRQEAGRAADSEISVCQPDGTRIFYGRCETVSLREQAGYLTAEIEAWSLSRDMDKTPMNRTFQDPSKTLDDVLQEAAWSHGATLTLTQNTAAGMIISQKGETDWAFILRIAAQFGMSVFTDITAPSILLSVGTAGFRSGNGNGNDRGIDRNVGELRKTLYNGEDAGSYQYDRMQTETDNLVVSAGDMAGGMFVTRSTVCNEGGILTNHAVSGIPVGIKPSYDTRTEETFYSTVLTGTVEAVNQNMIQVSFSAPGGGSGLTWIPYESPVSNSFYCMPDTQDSVFLYYENNGNIICLGSKRSDVSWPEYDKPEEKSMTCQNKMIKMKEKAIHLTATKDKDEADSEETISIRMNEEEGITIQSGMDIVIKADQSINLFTMNKTKLMEMQEVDTALKEGAETFAAREQAGRKEYNSKSGMSGQQEFAGYMGLGIKQDMTEVGQNIWNTAKGMVFYDIWSQWLPGDEPAEEEEAFFDQGVLSLYGVLSLRLEVKDSIIDIGRDINIAAREFSWLGYTQNVHEMEVDALQDWWETALDGLQLVMDICGFIPGFGAFFDLANAGISLARGDYAGAAMSALAAIPGIGDAAAAAKIGIKGVKQAYKAVEFVDRTRKTVQAIYAGVNAVASVIRNWDSISSLGERMYNGDFDIRNREDVDRLIALGHCGVSIYGAAKTATEAITGEEYRMDPDITQALVANENIRRMKCGDPIDVVSGSQIITYTDIQLADISDVFKIERHYESAYNNMGSLLGSRWMLGIESCLRIEGGCVRVMMPDMHLEVFDRTNDGFVNQRGGTGFLELREHGKGYCLTDRRTSQKSEYDSGGKLRYITDRNGNRTSLIYEQDTLKRIELAGGQYLDIAYQEGKISSIRDILGRETSYEYDGKLLSCVRYPHGGAISYDYTPEGYLRSITSPNGQTYITNHYDQKGRVVSQELVGKEEYVLFYDDINRRNTFTTLSNGKKIIYQYNHKRLPVRIEYEDGSYEETQYDDWENPVYHRDRKGGVILREYDAAGRLLSETLPNGLETTYTYDDTGHLLSKTDNAGREWHYRVDANGNVTEEKIRLSEDNWAVTTLEWDENGRLLRYVNGAGEVSLFRYEKGFSGPSSMVGPDGSVTRYTFDPAGRKMEEIGEDGIRSYGYNHIDYLTMETDEEGHTKRYVYSPLCELVEEILPREYNGGNQSHPGTRYVYDALSNLVRTINPEGEIRGVHSDAEGNVIKEINPNTYVEETDDGEGVVYAYDTDNHRTHIHYPDGGTERFFYDAAGNLVKWIKPVEYDPETDDGKGYSYQYDCVNRLVQVTDPEGMVVRRYVYDLCGNIIKEITAKGYAMGDNDEERPGILYSYNHAGWRTEERVPVCLAEECRAEEKEPVALAEGRQTEEKMPVTLTDECRTVGEEEKMLYRLTRFAYDAMGRQVQEKRYLDYQTQDSNRGRLQIIRFHYNKSGRLDCVEDDGGAQIRYAYDHKGRLTEEKIRLQEGCWKETRYRYDRAGRLETVLGSADEEGCGSKYSKTQLKRDANGNLTSILTPAGYRIRREYDHANRVVLEEHIEPGGDIHNRIAYRYDKAGSLVMTTFANGSCVSYAYDLLNREIRRTGANGGTTATFYDRNGRVAGKILPREYREYNDGLEWGITEQGIPDKPEQGMPGWQVRGRGYRYAYDIRGRQISVTGPDGNVLRETDYSPWGEVLKESRGGLDSAWYTYDFSGRMRGVTTAGGSSQSFVYDARGNVVQSTDGNRNITRFHLDQWGRATCIRKADGSTELYSYNHAGSITRATDGEGNTTAFEYNAANLMSVRIDPCGGEEHFLYDQEGRLREYRNRNQGGERYRYNLYGDLVHRESLDGSIQESWGYTPDGLLSHALGGGMRYEYAYYPCGLLKEKRASGRMLLSYEYDLNGNRVRQSDITGKTTEYRYDTLDRLTEIYDNGTRLAAYEYNSDNTLKRMETGKDLVTEYGYDKDRNLSGLRTTFCDELLTDNSYTYDGNGNQVTKQTISGLTSYRYDALDRLVSVEYPDRLESFCYDSADNRIGRVCGSVEEEYRYDQRNRLTERQVHTPVGIHRETYEYDDQGNLLKDGQASYLYDGFNRMYEVRMDDGQIQRNRYDAEGLRHEMEENGRLVQFLYSGEELEAERDEEEKVTRYIWGYQLISSDSESARTYYHYASDEMGSVTHVVEEESRRVKNRYGYDAFGNMEYAEENVRNRFRYTGQQYDSVTGQYYLRARYYNPVIGRFLQEDTYYGDGLNLYAYCRNNPVRYYDPSGHDTCPKALHDQMKGQGIPNVEIAKKVQDVQALVDKGLNIEEAYKQITKLDYPGSGGNVAKGASEAGVTVGSDGQTTVYRVIRPDENPDLGLTAKNPDATYMVEGHILNGSKDNFNSQYISTTTDIEVAQTWSNKTGNGIVEIDLSSLSSDTKIYDLSTDAGRSEYLKGNTATNWAKSSSEVLIEGYVPSEAVKKK